MKFLLDAHVILWAAYMPGRLSPRVATLVEDESNELIVSHASLCELLNKIGRGKLLPAGNDVFSAEQRFLALDITLIPILYSDILAAARLPHHHSDPFDRLLIAQSHANDLPVVTADPMLSRYSIQTIWD